MKTLIRKMRAQEYHTPEGKFIRSLYIKMAKRHGEMIADVYCHGVGSVIWEAVKKFADQMIPFEWLCLKLLPVYRFCHERGLLVPKNPDHTSEDGVAVFIDDMRAENLIQGVYEEDYLVGFLLTRFIKPEPQPKKESKEVKHETCANPACARSFEIPRGKPNQRYCSVRCYHEANGRAGVQAGKRTPAKDQAEAALGAVNVVYEEEALRRPSHPNTPDPVIESKPNPKEDEMILEFRKPRASKSVPLDLLDALDPDDLALYLDARKIEKACALEVHRLREQLQEAERLHRQASIDLDDLKEGLMTRSEAS